MHLTAIGGNTATGASAASTATSTVDQQFASLIDDPKDTLADITSGGIKGYMSWKIEQMKKKMAADVMAGMNLTPEKIAAMSDKDRTDVENKIIQAVESQLKLQVAEDMKRQVKKQLEASNSLGGVLSAAQSI